MTPEIQAVLFDVGGVLVEVSGVERLRSWTDPSHSDEDLWALWLGSEAVRAFEAGKIPAWDFADRLIAEMDLPVARGELLDEFVRWISGPWPGALELIEDVRSDIRLATLSNSNPLHWPRIMDEMGFGGYFATNFVSHLTGHIKPDSETFEHAVTALGCRPDAIVFVDDNQINIGAARRIGIHAHRVRGPGEAREILDRYQLLRER